jgi:predicted hotdog family 3-hydroxylacyl-ACP dehydratase
VSAGSLRELIPHALRMCLLDAVESWDDTQIRCSTASHRDPLNPLRSGAQLAALHLCEYGAQATAAHGGLLARREHGARAAPGMLVALREVELSVDRVDDIEGPLTVTASVKVAAATGCLYDFEISAGSRRLARGRVSVIFAGAGPA